MTRMEQAGRSALTIVVDGLKTLPEQRSGVTIFWTEGAACVKPRKSWHVLETEVFL